MNKFKSTCNLPAESHLFFWIFLQKIFIPKDVSGKSPFLVHKMASFSLLFRVAVHRLVGVEKGRLMSFRPYGEADVRRFMIVLQGAALVLQGVVLPQFAASFL